MQSAKQASGSGNREAKGFLFLISLLLTPFLFQYTYRAFFYKRKSINLSSVEYLMDSCEQQTSFNNTFYANNTEKKNFESKKTAFKKENTHESIDINNADTTLFKSLPGIGSVYASRIVKYRNLLGGFVEIDQIKEVYGIKSELFEQIKSYLTVHANHVKKIPADSLWENPYMFYHPYLSKELKAGIKAENKQKTYSATRLKEMIETSNKRLGMYMFWE